MNKKSLRKIIVLFAAVIVSCANLFAQTSLPTGYGKIKIGMSVDEVKKILQSEKKFGFRGDRDVSMMPRTEQVLIETDASEVDGTIAAFDSAVEAGEIFELTFRVKDDVPVGEYDIYFDCIAEDADYEKYEYGIINRFHVLECERGDFNYDDRINSADVIYLVRSVLNPDKYILDQDGDLNRDGVFNTEDALYLLRHIMHNDRYPLENQHYNDNPPSVPTGGFDN